MNMLCEFELGVSVVRKFAVCQQSLWGNVLISYIFITLEMVKTKTSAYIILKVEQNWANRIKLKQNLTEINSKLNVHCKDGEMLIYKPSMRMGYVSKASEKLLIELIFGWPEELRAT